MILAALIDLGVDAPALQRQLASLKVGRVAIRARRVTADGMRGTRVNVVVPDHNHGHPHSRRGLKMITRLITRSRLPEPVKKNAISVFCRLAEAEAKIHGTTMDAIHFHEVGAVDSIIDICGACLAMHMLDITLVSVGPLPLGHGTISCEHGILPSPAPATVELLKGMQVTRVDEPFELVTPTGAALFAVWRTGTAWPGELRLAGSGSGIGHRRLKGRPNMLRAILYDTAAGVAGEMTDTCLVLECNIDDMSPQVIGDLTGVLFTAGALDVFTTPVMMKKQRPGVLLTALCRQSDREAMIDTIFNHSTTFGIRVYPVQRAILARRLCTVRTAYGLVRIKIGTRQGRVLNRVPEYDDCVAIARRRGVSLRRVMAAAQAVADRHG